MGVGMGICWDQAVRGFVPGIYCSSCIDVVVSDTLRIC